MLLNLILTLMMTAQSAPSAHPWQAYADPAEAGFNMARLEAARVHADTSRTAAVMAIHQGRVVAAWGAVDRPLMAHSVRKSLAGALYGMALHDGTLSLTDSLATLGIDDHGGLTAGEKAATFGDLVASRSGVYLPGAYADSSQDKGRPARGSHAPGTFWFYNNWDFNTAETIYERKTGEDLYAAFDRRIARVIGMEDFDPEGQLEVLEPGRSQYPAHTMRISARDLARFGQLYLQEGRWGDRQVVPAAWVRESVKVRSVTGNKMGYGYLWWIYEPGALGASFPVLDRMAVYLARGTGGQAVFVIPQAEMVVVHRADTDNGRSVPGPAIWQLVERLVGARDGQPGANPRLTAMSPVPLASNLPAPMPVSVVSLDAAARRRVAGQYEMAPGVIARVFEHDGRLFVSIPGQGEAELFATSPLTFVVKVEAGITVVFQADQDGAITAVAVTMGRQTMVGRRLSAWVVCPASDRGYVSFGEASNTAYRRRPGSCASHLVGARSTTAGRGC